MFKKIAIGIILNGAALYAVMYFVPGLAYTGGVWFFVIGGVVMGILNSIVKPVLKLVTLPLHIITLGLSLIILNAIIFWIFQQIIATLAIDAITITVSSIKTYFFAGILFGLINWVEHLIVHNK